jgi:hypothetical protein
VATTTFLASIDPFAVSAMKPGPPPRRCSRVTSTPQRIGELAKSANASMNPAMSAAVANASGSLWGKGKSGNRTDQFGNWNFNPSQRSLRQRSAIRCRSSTR